MPFDENGKRFKTPEQKARAAERQRQYLAEKRADPEWDAKRREYERERSARRRVEQPDKVSEWNRKAGAKYYAKTADRQRAYRRAYYEANSETERARQRAYSKTERGKELARANAKAYRERNPNLSRIRAWRQRGARSDAYEWVAILLNDPCCYCGNQMEEIDHITAVTLGGNGSWENLTAACQNCNRSKKNRPLLHWLAKRADMQAA